MDIYFYQLLDPNRFDKDEDEDEDESYAMPCSLDEDIIEAFQAAQRPDLPAKSDRQIVREMFPEILCAVVAGYPLHDIHTVLIPLADFKGTLSTLRRYLALERKQHPRLASTVRDRILADFHEATASPILH